MANQEQIEEDFLSCYICFDVFKEPKTLVCLHRFCEQCLHNYIVGLITTTVNQRRGFNCPICREFIAAPDPRSPPSDWAALFRTDFHLKNLIKFVEQKKERLQENLATKIQHPCPVHKDKDLDLYCADCDKLVCHLCAGISHRRCGQVVSIAEVAEDRRARLESALHDTTSKLNEVLACDILRESYLSQLERQKSAVQEDIKSWGHDLRHAITAEENRLLEQLQEKYDILKDKTCKKFLKFDNRVAEVRSRIKDISTKTMVSSDFDLVSDGTLRKVIEDIQEMNNVPIKEYKRFLKNLSSVEINFSKSSVPLVSMGDVLFSFDRNHTDEEDNSSISCVELSKPQVEAEGCKNNKDTQWNLSNERQKWLTPSPTANITDRTQPQPELRNYSAATISSIRSASVSKAKPGLATHRNSFSFQETPAISSPRPILLRTINTRFREDAMDPKLRDLIVMSPGNSIIATDWANQCVKAFHIRRDKDARLVLGGKPWAITQMTDVLAAVSLPMSKQICIIKTAPSLTLQNSFVSPKNYSGLASLNSTMLVASGGSHPPSVDIINLYGEVLKSFTHDGNGTPLFSYPAYVTVTTGLLILVSDRKHGAVMAISHTGKVKFNFQPEGARCLKEPSGVTSNPTGCIYSVESRGLLTLTPDGQFERTLLTPKDGILHDPRGVALDSEGLLYVTSHEDQIKVLKIM